MSGVNDVIYRFADENNLPRDWMNTDFMRTASYSDKLTGVSRHYCWLNNQTLEIRTVSGIYLIAMKLVSRRDYRNDISDAVGIMIEEAEAGNHFTYEQIEDTCMKLYNKLPDPLVQECFRQICSMFIDEQKQFYQIQKETEYNVGVQLMQYIDNGVNVIAQNVVDIAAQIRKKMEERSENDSES